MKLSTFQTIGITAVVFISFLFLSGCAVNPVTGRKQISLMSEAQEIALGAESDPQIIAQFGLYEDATIQKFIDLHGQEMAAISHRPNLKYQFRILDSPVVNAFAVPGGYVYFTRGIMAHFNNEAEFAGVLGHEIGHITAKHSVDQYTKSTIAQVLLVGGLIVSPEFRTFANEAQTAMQLLFLKYSRDNESQSDELGVEYSSKVGYDAHQMADFFNTLKSLSTSEDGQEIPTFLSTHPDPLDRNEKVDAMATEWQNKLQLPSYKVNRQSYLDMIDGIIYGEDPQQGYVENSTFYHPGLKFSFPVPNSWLYDNSPTQFQMAPKDGKALMVLMLAEGNSLQTAASNSATQLKLTVSNTRQIKINGLDALEVRAQQITDDPASGQKNTIDLQSVYIQYGQFIYVIHGLSLPADFAVYKSHFDKTMYGFGELKDQSKINVKPDRIKVVPVKSNGTLGQALLAYAIPTDKHREHGIVNGMDPTDQVTAGEKIKIIIK
jgi:predicted Zn-dependent protease